MNHSEPGVQLKTGRALAVYAVAVVLIGILLNAAAGPVRTSLAKRYLQRGDSAFLSLKYDQAEREYKKALHYNASLTEATGTERLFNSPVLEAGKTFKYAIKASWTIDGKTKEQTRDVEFQAGQSTTVDFRVAQSENVPQSESDLNK